VRVTAQVLVLASNHLEGVVHIELNIADVVQIERTCSRDGLTVLFLKHELPSPHCPVVKCYHHIAVRSKIGHSYCHHCAIGV